jgi:hypothetical protein
VDTGSRKESASIRTKALLFRRASFACKIGHGSIQIKLMAIAKFLTAVTIGLASFAAYPPQTGSARQDH